MAHKNNSVSSSAKICGRDGLWISQLDSFKKITAWSQRDLSRRGSRTQLWEVVQWILLEKFNSFAPMSLTSTLHSLLYHVSRSRGRFLVEGGLHASSTFLASFTAPCWPISSILPTAMLSIFSPNLYDWPTRGNGGYVTTYMFVKTNRN